MRFVAIGLLLLMAGCKNDDLISAVPEPAPDGPVPDAGPPDLDLRCTTPDTCDDPADCDDCNDCTSEDCVDGSCEYQDVPCGCCIIQLDSPGCGNEIIEDCVCELPENEICCDTEWDQTCVEDVSSRCGACDCCTPHSEPGCYDAVAMSAAISDCVCALDPLCCSRPAEGFGWDAQCVSDVVDFGCGTCP